MKSIVKYLFLALCLCAPLTEVQADSSLIIYVEVLSPPPAAVWLEPDLNGKRLENTQLYISAGASDRLATRWLVAPGDVYRGRLESEWVRIEPDEGAPDPFTHEVGRVSYLPTAAVRVLTAVEMSALPVQMAVPAWDRVIVVEQDETPEVYAVEISSAGARIVFHVPAFLGGGAADRSTPVGDFRVYLARVADNMPSFWGVPWVMYFTGDRALHQFHGWNWGALSEGGYGTRGCVNLPDISWHTAMVDGQITAAGNWLFRWLRSVPEADWLQSWDPTQLGKAFLSSEGAGWYDLSRTVRTVVTYRLDDLYELVPNSRLHSASLFTNWSQVVPLLHAQYDWILSDVVAGELVAKSLPRGVVPPVS